VTSVAAIVVAAGSGDRLGLGIAKAFVEVGDRPLLAIAIDAVRRCPGLREIVAVVPGSSLDHARELVDDATVRQVVGGASRQASVRSGLLALTTTPDVVVVHDAARPFADPELFERVVSALDRWDAVVPAVAVTDTVKRVTGDGAVVRTEPREELVTVQTPQAFRASALADAHQRAHAGGLVFTDDAACLEWAGHRVGVVPGDPSNFKITTPEDLQRANEILGGRRG
jgi:2-C-methyl-D-erythritol 4-phosphate cytidylyltransferase